MRFLFFFQDPREKVYSRVRLKLLVFRFCPDPALKMNMKDLYIRPFFNLSFQSLARVRMPVLPRRVSIIVSWCRQSKNEQSEGIALIYDGVSTIALFH